MKKINIVLLSIITILFTVSCSSVTTRYPLSVNPKSIDQQKFEGIWQVDNDDAAYIKFGGDGIGRIAGLEWKEDQFFMINGEMIVTEGVENNFLSVRFQEDGKWPDNYYLLSYMFVEQGDLVLWLPDEDVFEEAVEKKKLNGIIEKEEYSKSIIITEVQEKLLEFLNNPNNKNLFDYREPVVLRKISTKTE